MQKATNVKELLGAAVERGASDIHLARGSQPMLRVYGETLTMNRYQVLDPITIENLLEQVIPEQQRQILDATGETDFAYGLPEFGRFRCNAFKQQGVYSLVMRLISSEIKSLPELGLPSVLEELAGKRSGLVLVTGPTGSGKSTTLAAMIDLINRQRKGVIITLEDPIEYLHTHKKCVVNQREIGLDTKSFASGLRSALRADPDVILVGEMRDLETIEVALLAAETGHLVLSTLHTRSAANTIDRVIDVFPSDGQQQIRVQLASVLEAVVSQQLLPRLGGRGMVPAVEIMLATPAIRNIIRESKTHQLQSMVETGSRYGMQTLDKAVSDLLRKNLVDEVELDWLVNSRYLEG